MSDHRERPSVDTDAEAPSLVRTTPSQLLEPSTVGPSPGQCHCTECNRQIGEGESIGVYAYRLSEASRWDIARLYCRECAPDRLVGPTLGAAELLVTGTLGTVLYPTRQSHRLCVAEALTRSVSPPAEGARP